MTEPREQTTLFDDTAAEPPPIPDGIRHPHRVNELRHGLTAIYVSRTEQILIAAGFLPDPARPTSQPEPESRPVPTYDECILSWSPDDEQGGAV